VLACGRMAHGCTFVDGRDGRRRTRGPGRDERHARLICGVGLDENEPSAVLVSSRLDVGDDDEDDGTTRNIETSMRLCSSRRRPPGYDAQDDLPGPGASRMSCRHVTGRAHSICETPGRWLTRSDEMRRVFSSRPCVDTRGSSPPGGSGWEPRSSRVD
jgi:hypothetical protein